MSLYEESVPQLKKMLTNLDRWLDKAESHAKAKKFEPSVLLTQRLAPDQYQLLTQIQAACDAAKFAVARVTGKTPPVHPDTETTWEQIKARIASVLSYLDTAKAADFEGAESRLVPLTFLPVPNKGVTAPEYLRAMAFPNFYFHVTTAYAILRHNGVDVGKIDYIGGLDLVDVPAT